MLALFLASLSAPFEQRPQAIPLGSMPGAQSASGRTKQSFSFPLLTNEN